MNKESKIYVAGHNGMVGSACWRLLKKEGFKKCTELSTEPIRIDRIAT